jgi:hypothetical protein
VLGGVLRKIDFLTQAAAAPGMLQPPQASLDGGMVADLKARLAGLQPPSPAAAHPLGTRALRSVRRLVMNRAVLERLLQTDRRIQAYLQTPARQLWLERYQRLRTRVRRGLG